MADKTYAVMNMSYRDETRTEDYLLTKTANEKRLNIPVNIPEYGIMYPDELTTVICTDTLREHNQ